MLASLCYTLTWPQARKRPRPAPSFATSNFKRCYTCAAAPEFQDEIMAAVRKVAEAFCRANGLDLGLAGQLYRELMAECIGSGDGLRELLGDVAYAAQRFPHTLRRRGVRIARGGQFRCAGAERPRRRFDLDPARLAWPWTGRRFSTLLLGSAARASSDCLLLQAGDFWQRAGPRWTRRGRILV